MNKSITERDVIGLYENIIIPCSDYICPASEGLSIIYGFSKNINLPAITNCNDNRLTSISISCAIESGMSLDDFSKIFNMGWYIDEDNELSFDV